ncbi:MAG: HAD family phosphatase [Candidatus Micrarchaeia archaeon]
MTKAVIFDFDGVLADTRQAAISAYKEALAEKGYRITSEEVRRFWGGGPFWTIKRFFESHGISKSRKEIEAIARRKTILQVKMVGRNRLLPGVKPLLSALKGHVLMGVATSNRLALAKAFLKHYKIDRFFSAIATAEAGDRPKPFPDQYLKAARLLGVRPKDCVAVEDMEVGIRAAKRAGMRVIGVAGGLEPEKKLKRAKPDLFVKSLRERKKILQFLLMESL